MQVNAKSVLKRYHATPGRSGGVRVYEALKEMILSFAIYPGSRITEQELADLFQVSRTPIREALQRLEAEGYLSIRPKQGCFVRQLDMEEISQYYQVRIGIEQMVVEGACINMPRKDLEKLVQVWQPSMIEANTSRRGGHQQLEEDFHMALAEGCGNRVLANYLRDINNHIRIIRRLDMQDYERLERTYQEHHDILEQILARNAGKAKTLIKHHIQRSEEFAKTITLTELARKKSFALAFGR